MKKALIGIIFIIVAAAAFWVVIPTQSQLVTPRSIAAQIATPLLTSSPAPIKLDSKSNLPSEAQKLTVPDYSVDYKALAESLSNF